MFYVNRRNSSSRIILIQSSLSRVRGPKDTMDMGGVKGNAVIALHTIHVCNVDNNLMGRHYGSSAHCKENSRAPTAML